jgi:uncharacterized membrane protein YjjB (DUF3815 family)
MRLALHAIVSQPPLYSFPLPALMSICSSLCIAILFFRLAPPDALLVLPLAASTAALAHAATLLPALAPLQPLLASLLAAFLANLLRATCLPRACVYPAAIAAIAPLLPGWAVTTAVIELAARSIISGTVRFVHALFTTLQLGFGLAVGARLVFWHTPDADIPCDAGLGLGARLAVFPLLAAARCVLLGAHPRQWPGVASSAGVAVAATVWLPDLVPADLVAMLAAALVGLWGCFVARLTREQPIGYLLAGVLLLVPGTVGVKGAAALFQHDTAEVGQFYTAMLTTTMCISVGLLVARLACPGPRRGSGRDRGRGRGRTGKNRDRENTTEKEEEEAKQRQAGEGRWGRVPGAGKGQPRSGCRGGVSGAGSGSGDEEEEEDACLDCEAEEAGVDHFV